MPHHDEHANLELRELGLNQVEADNVVRRIRGHYREAQHKRANDAVLAALGFYAPGLKWQDTRRALHAAAVLSQITEATYVYMAQILIRIASSGHTIMREMNLPRRWGIPLRLLQPESADIPRVFPERTKYRK